MFTDGDGNTVHPHAVYEGFRRIVHNAEVPTLRFHDLRHTHGSLLIKEGVPVKVVSERLGHAHIAHTMQTYPHVLPGMQADAADTTERLANPRPTSEKAAPKEGPTKATTPKKATAKKTTKPARKTPVERRGNNRRKAA